MSVFHKSILIHENYLELKKNNTTKKTCLEVFCLYLVEFKKYVEPSNYLLMKKLSICSILLTTALLVSCGKHQIEGTVIDNFGEPVEGMKVSIKGTAFETLTDSDGDYALSFVPGTIDMQYEDEGYMNVYRTYEIAAETDFPAKTVETIKLPPSYTPNSMLVQIDGQYVSLPKEVLITSYRKEHGYTKDNNIVYLALPDDKELPVVPEGRIKVYFQDKRKVTLVRIGEGIQTIELGTFHYQVSGGKTYRGKFSMSNEAIINLSHSHWENPKGNDISNFMDGIWEMELSKGRYALIPHSDKKREYFVDGRTWAFEVE